MSGWSRGYLGFWSFFRNVGGVGSIAIAATYSTDGIHWRAGQTLVTDEPQKDGGATEGVSVVEGPAGLLAIGWTGGCGSMWAARLWTSTDGVSWQAVEIQKAFGSTQVFEISAGPGGYVAVGYGGAAWVSADGRSWRRVDLTASGSKGSKIDSGAAFSGGYVLAGSDTGMSSCGTEPEAARQPAVWWSADGSQWTREQLPGGEALSGPYGAYAVCRINDHALLVTGVSWGEDKYNHVAWTSTDGKTWKAADDLAEISGVLTDGRHGMLVDLSYKPVVVRVFNDDLELATLPETGDAPVVPPDTTLGFPQNWSVAVGPTGVLVAHGEQLWIGIPSVG